MRRPILLLLAFSFTLATPSEGATRILLVARDLKDNLLPGLEFACEGIVSRPTNRAGATELELAPDLEVGDKIVVHLVTSTPKAQDWFLVDPEVNVPNRTSAASVVLMRRSEIRRLAADCRDSPSSTAFPNPIEPSSCQDVPSLAKRFGLTELQIEKTLLSFAETVDPKDRAIAAFLRGDYSATEKILSGVPERQLADVVETLRYRGASQFHLGKYRSAAGTLRIAVSLKPDDAATLSWLGITLLELAEWQEAEPILLRVVELVKAAPNLGNLDLAMALNNLACLYLDTDRFVDAEALLPRALSLAESSAGPNHPSVATVLGSLSALYYHTERIVQAEALIRRALAIDSQEAGSSEDSLVVHLVALTRLLRATGKLEEARTQLGRAIALDQKVPRFESPQRVSLLLAQAELLLRADCFTENDFVKRPSDGTWYIGIRGPTPECAAEIEDLLRRSLAAAERQFGPQHRAIATILERQFELIPRWDFIRNSESEDLLRRALNITEKSYGPDNPRVVAILDELGDLLHRDCRDEEALPLLLRSLSVQDQFFRRTHQESTQIDRTQSICFLVLENLGRPDEDIEDVLREWELASKGNPEPQP